MDFFTLDIRKKVFTVRVARHCNRLPIAVLDTPTRPHSSGRSQQRAREAREGPEPQRRGGEGRGAQRSGVGLEGWGGGTGMGETLRCCWKEGWWEKMEERKKYSGQGRPAGFAPPPQKKKRSWRFAEVCCSGRPLS